MDTPTERRAQPDDTIVRQPNRSLQSRWLVPPRLRAAADTVDERHATWLELFFDLVFVIAIAGLAHQLLLDQSTAGFLRFAALFVPVYVAWQGYMAYADRFDSDDLAFRFAYFAAMLAIAAMAVVIGDVARGAKSAEFAIAYVVLRSVLLGLYGRAWRSVPEARPLIRRYGIGYSVGVAIWLASLAVDTPIRYVVWGVALVLELSLPPLSTSIHRRVPTHGSHLPERWGLFTLIVLGESVVVVSLETADANWRLESAAAAVLGFAAVTAVWWLYFDRQANTVLRGTSPAPVIYSYAHLPLLIGLTAMSVGVGLLIERAGEDQLGMGPSVALLGGVMLFLLSLVATRSVTVSGPRRLGVLLKLGAVAVILGLLLAEAALPPVAVGGGLVGVLAALVFTERALFPPAQSAS